LRLDFDLRVALGRGGPCTGSPLPGGPAPGICGILPDPAIFIIFAICLRASSSWLTCSRVVPEPAAIRFRREPFWFPYRARTYRAARRLLGAWFAPGLRAKLRALRSTDQNARA